MQQNLFHDIQPLNRIWVSNNAAQGGDGSADRPFNTIQLAVDAATAGTAILVKAGEYHENIKLPTNSPGTAAAPIWLISADGAGAAKIVAVTDNLSAVYGYGTDNFVVKDFRIEGGKNGIQFSQSGSDFSNMVRNVVIEGNVIVNSKEDGIKVDHANNVHVIANTTANSRNEGIDFVAVNNSVVAHNDVSEARGSAGIMVKGGSTNVLIEANAVHDIPVMDGILLGGWTEDKFFTPGFTGYEAKNVTVIGNDVHDVAKRPLNVLGAVDSQAVHNYLEANYAYFWAVNVGAGNPNAHTIAHSSNIEIAYNIIANRLKFSTSTDSAGISFHDNTLTGAWDTPTGPDTAARTAPPQGTEPAGPGVSIMAGVEPTAMVGTPNTDTLTGGDGNDVLDGGAGSDSMSAGAGDDTYIVDDVADIVVESAASGSDKVKTGLAYYALPDNVEKLTYIGEENFEGVGNAARNTIHGGAGNDVMDGGRGSDRLDGGLGDDLYIVDSTKDSIVNEAAGGGFDVVHSFANAFMLRPNLEVLVFRGTGDFLGQGNAGNNYISGANGNDSLDGGAGADTLAGGKGDDQYTVDHASDLVIEAGEGGIDTVLSSVRYVLGANEENVVLTGSLPFPATGNDLNNTMVGNIASNTINGGVGNDRIDGAGGSDKLIGGSGHDTFVFKAGEANGDKVIDFISGEDFLEFTGYDAATVSVVAMTNSDWLVSDGVHTDRIHLSSVLALNDTDYGFI